MHDYIISRYIGSHTVKADPSSGRLSTSIRPWHSEMILLTRARPRPFPSPPRAASPRTNRSSVVFALVEFIEDMGLYLRRHTDSGVLDFYTYGIGGAVAADADGASRRGELDCV